MNQLVNGPIIQVNIWPKGKSKLLNIKHQRQGQFKWHWTSWKVKHYKGESIFRTCIVSWVPWDSVEIPNDAAAATATAGAIMADQRQRYFFFYQTQNKLPTN